MPLKAAPDPNNPGGWIWVDSATGQPAAQPGGAGTPYVTQPTANPNPPGGVNIDPNAGRQPTATTAPATPTTTPTAPATTGPRAGPAGPGEPSLGGYTVAQIIAPTDAEVNAANDQINTLWGKITDQQAVVTNAQAKAQQDPASLQAATSTLNALYQAYTAALGKAETANTARATALNTAIHNGTVDPSAVAEAHARADQATATANQANANADVLRNGAESQKQLVVAQSAEVAQRGLLESAQADLAKAQASKIPADIAQATAQTNALQAQADSTKAMIGPLVDKTKADTTLTTAQANLTDENSNVARATVGKTNADAALANAQAGLAGGQLAAGLPQAQTAQAAGAGAQAQAAAAQTTAEIEAKKLGPLYGLQDKINAIQAIQQHVFGPGGSGTPEERAQQASDMLDQFTQATLAGTTPYEANVAAANAGLTQFGTQASLANAAQSAAASRASAFTGLGGTVFGQLAQMNANAPKGSTAIVGAFNDVLNNMQGRLQAPQFAGPQTPTAPPLPALLQRLAPAGAPTPTPTPTAPPGGMLPAPGGLPATAPTGQPAPSTTAPITINVGGGAQTQPQPQPQQSSMQAAGLSMPGMPAMLQNYAPASVDYLHQLWGNELGSGAIKSPFGNTIGALA